MERDRYAPENSDDDEKSAERKHAARQHIRVPLPREVEPELPPVEKNPLWRFERRASGLLPLLDDKEQEPHPRDGRHESDLDTEPDDDDESDEAGEPTFTPKIAAPAPPPPIRPWRQQWQPERHPASGKDEPSTHQKPNADFVTIDDTQELPIITEVSHAPSAERHTDAEADLAEAVEARTAAGTALTAMEEAIDTAQEDETPVSPPPPKPPYIPRHAATPNSVSPPPAPPHTPHAAPPDSGDGMPPVPPFFDSNPFNNPNLPAPGAGFGGYDTAPPPRDFQPAPVVIEREHTTDRFGNVLSLVAIIGLLREKGKRKKGDAKNEAAIVREGKRLDEQRVELATHTQKLREHERAIQRQTSNNYMHAAPPNRAPEAFAPPGVPGHVAQPEYPHPAAPGVPLSPRPEMTHPNQITPEVRPIVLPTQNQNMEQQIPAERPPEFAVAPRPEQYIPQNAVQGGREAVNALRYGQEFQRERQREAAPHVTPGFAASIGAAVTPSVGGSVADVPTSAHSSLPSGMTSPSLPLGNSMYQDPQHRLPASHKGSAVKGNLLLWALVALVAFAVVMGISLL